MCCSKDRALGQTSQWCRSRRHAHYKQILNSIHQCPFMVWITSSHSWYAPRFSFRHNNLYDRCHLIHPMDHATQCGITMTEITTVITIIYFILRHNKPSDFLRHPSTGFSESNFSCHRGNETEGLTQNNMLEMSLSLATRCIIISFDVYHKSLTSW